MAGLSALVLGWLVHIQLAQVPLENVAAFACIESTVLGEARGETVIGRAMVRRVILNRAESLGSHPCEVVRAQFQFDGYSLWALVHLRADWRSTEFFVLRKGCGVATHFHATSVRPKWSRHPSMQYLCRIGNHHFYEELK